MYNIKQEDLIQKLGSSVEQGLSQELAAQRLAADGANVLKEEKRPGILVKFFSQFKDFMVIILLIAAFVSYVVSGHAVDSVVILIVVLLNALLGVIQESRAEKSLDALKRMAAPSAKVLRDGQRNVIPASEVVVGDIIFVEAGDLVPADARLLDCGSLKVEESALTGESLPVEKHDELITEENIPLGDRKNMIYSTTIVTYGRATALVTAIGMASECGKIATALSDEEEEMTPLQKRLAQIGTYLGIMAIVICAIIFGIGLLEGTPFEEIFMTAVTLAVAAIPEGLPAIVTIVLAMGVQRLVKRNAIIRKLPAVETLGSASVVCSDKTGTLTLNRMTVTHIYFEGELFPLEEQNFSRAIKVLEPATLCCDGSVETQEDGTLKHIGDPTETAMVAALLTTGTTKGDLNEKYPRVEEIPFDSDRKLMSTVHEVNGRVFSVTKGAPDQVLARCVGANADAIMAANKQMGDKALRVLAVAVRELSALPTDPTSDTLEVELQFVGLIGMIDPPRQEAKDAVTVCRGAGITPVMITGDHKNTAVAIARELGIICEETHKAITGAELDKLSDEELAQTITDMRVYARVSPEHKIRIVKAWKANGQVVAMTGDGVNDAPALKAADIGCAMGITGTEVSKGAADMILTDDNFATITAAVEEGRGIYQNIKKCISFLLSSNLGEVLAIFVAMVAGLGTPLLPTQILWVNLVTDSLPALALGVEPVEKDVMSRKPLPANQGFFTKGTIFHILSMGVMIAALTLISYCLGMFWLPSHSPEIAHTMAFTTLALGQLFHSFNMRSNHSLFKVGFFGNRYLVLALLGGIALQAIVYFVPFLASVFELAPLATTNMLWAIGLAIAPIPIVEIVKGIIALFAKKD